MPPLVHAGTDDIRRITSALSSRLPWPLGVFARLAYNYRWAWMPDGPDLFRAIDNRRWRLVNGNPVRLLQEASAESLLRAASDDALIAHAEATEDGIQADLARPFREEVVSADRPIAYFCAEYAIHASMPIYSGGLGALAGDVVKEASDLALPFVAVGLMYRRGYFRQRIDNSGWQQEFWVPTDPERTPAVLVTEGDDRTPVRITVPIGDDDVHAQIWRVNAGRVPVFLLDTELPENNRVTRWITSRLYDGDTGTRLAQYTLLGAGGIAALRALGIEPGVVHMNEGHAALTALELARGQTSNGTSFEAALEASRQRSVFTTHTPVPAGNDTYPADQVAATLRRVTERAGTEVGSLIRLGRTHMDDEGEPVGVTQLALRSSRAANGVSKRHGEVAREMWHAMWPDRGVDDVPITHVTNGVHVPTWVGAPMRRLLDRHVGEGWAQRLLDSDDPLAAIEQIPAEELWAVRCDQRARLVEFVKETSVRDRVARGEPRHYAEAAANAFDPEVLTVGFARRLATYKRLNLLFRDPERSLRIISGDRPIQLLIAGKAHPKDDGGKRLVQDLFGVRWNEAAAARVVFLEDYDLHVAGRLVRGCDVWVNVPRPPLEASGTSGMKSVVNGGLNLSVLDGWWAEAYDGENGWAIDGETDADHEAQDHRHAAELYRLIEEAVVPEFHDRDGSGIPQRWVQRIKRSMRTNIPRFSASRMVTEYEERLYRS
jgi:starch phosphorylase